MRSILLVLDSAGIGGAPDADTHGDRGADTLGHIFAHTPDLALPALFSLGLGAVLAGHVAAGHDPTVRACYGRMREHSPGKDSVTGHWELAGVPVKQPFASYERFPPQLVEAIEAEAKVHFIGNCPGTGTEILKEFGATHCATGAPILYTSAESAMRIAAHEKIVPRKRLYEICRIARRHCNAYRIARVVARPFLEKAGAYVHSPGRHEYPLAPPRTILNALSEAGLVVEGIGKIPALFAGSGVTHSRPARTNREVMRQIDQVWETMHDGLLFANLSEFDLPHGHRRDVAGYARALTRFDAWLAGFLPKITRDDLLIVTADHGNDPTFRGTSHTREEVPLLVKYGDEAGPLGTRETFADVAATLRDFFHLEEKWPAGTPFFDFETNKPRHFHPRR